MILNLNESQVRSVSQVLVVLDGAKCNFCFSMLDDKSALTSNQHKSINSVHLAQQGVICEAHSKK